MMTSSMAFRNLIRNRRRTIATLLAIAIGALSVLLFGGYSADIKYALQTSYIRSGGHLQIQHRDYFLYGSGNPTAYGIENFSKIIDAIKLDPVLQDMVVVVTPVLVFGGVAGNYSAGVSRTIIGNGIVASDRVRMREWNEYDVSVVAPTFRLANSPSNAAIIGVGLARVLQLCEVLNVSNCPVPEKQTVVSGSNIPAEIAQLISTDISFTTAVPNLNTAIPTHNIELLASSARGIPNVASLAVVQAENLGFKELDEVSLFLHLAQAQRLVYGASPPKVTAIVIQLRETSQASKAIDRISSQLPRWGKQQLLVVHDFGTLNPYYVESMALFDSIFGFMFVLIGGIVMFTVSNTMNTAVVERTAEIGTLRAMGLRRAGIRHLFVTEGAMLGVSGALLGVGASLITAFIVNRSGLQWLPPGNAELVPLNLKVWGETGMVLGTAVSLALFTTLSAWWPAYRAANLTMVDALRHV